LEREQQKALAGVPLSDGHTASYLEGYSEGQTQCHNVWKSKFKHLNKMYIQQENRFYCLLEAPYGQAVDNHHNKHGVKCEWITEVKTTA
jgi:hypothetical protein